MLQEKDSSLSTRGNMYVRFLGALLVISGLISMIGGRLLFSLYRGKFMEVGALVFKMPGHSGGSLLLLYIAAGLPVGAVLVAAGAALMSPGGTRVLRVLLPLLVFQLVYFNWHAGVAFSYDRLPTMAFAISGWLLVVLFAAVVWLWLQKRSVAVPARQLVLDLQMAAAICFFTAAWHVCSFASVPGLGVYPQLVQKFGSRSFLIGQALAVNIFACLGFIFLFIAVRYEPEI